MPVMYKNRKKTHLTVLKTSLKSEMPVRQVEKISTKA